MSRIVCDASLLAALLLPDEWTAKVPQVMGQLLDAELWAPAHLPIELGSLIVSLQRDRRVTDVERHAFLATVGDFIETLDALSAQPSAAITDLAIATKLTVYDAAYLELAVRRNAVLATNDRELKRAARKLGVKTLSTRA